MRLLITLVLLFFTISVSEGRGELPPIRPNQMRITAEITLKCAFYKKYKIQIQMKDTDFLSRDDEIGKLWKFQSKKKKAKTVFIYGDTGSDGWLDNTLEVFLKIEHNCTPDRTVAKTDFPIEIVSDEFSRKRQKTSFGRSQCCDRELICARLHAIVFSPALVGVPSTCRETVSLKRHEKLKLQDFGKAEKLVPFDVGFEANTTYPLPLAARNYAIWNLDDKFFQ